MHLKPLLFAALLIHDLCESWSLVGPVTEQIPGEVLTVFYFNPEGYKLG